MKMNFVNEVPGWKQWVIAGILALTFPARAAEAEQDFIAVLQSGAGAVEKCAACQKLRIIGTAKAVPALAALLGEERTGHAARYALEGMPLPSAGAALREALGRTTGLIKAGLVDSLGWRGEPESIPLLSPLLADPNPNIAGAAAAALGRIGGPAAVTALTNARDKAPPDLQKIVLEGLIQCAERRLTGGDRPGAATIYRELFHIKYPVQIRAAAWRGLVLSDTKQRVSLLASALSGTDHPIHLAALKLLRELDDPSALKICASDWPKLPTTAQLAILEICPKLGPDAAAVISAAIHSQEQAVRVAGWQALAGLNDPKMVAAAAQTAAGDQITEREAARTALARMNGNGVRAAFLELIPTAQLPVKAELLRALGERGDTTAAGVLVENARSDSELVRLAALEALKKIAVADTLMPLLDLAAAAKSDAGREPVLQALRAVCRASRDKDQTIRQIIGTLERFPAQERRQVLPLLSELGGPEALKAVQSATRDTNAELAKEAIRVLAQWPSAAPAAYLLELARTSTNLTMHTLAMRGCIEVTTQEPEPAKRLATLQQAMAIARRPDEKRQALGQIGQIPTAEALQTVLKALADAGLANEAAVAAINIAEKLAPTQPALAEEAAAKVLEQCKTPEIVKRAWAIRRKPQSSPFIRDWLVCGPYSQADVTGALAVFNLAFGPEKKGEKVTWKAVPPGDHVNLAGLFPGRDNCVAYLTTKIIVPENCDGALLMGSDDGIKAWLNGEVVHSNNIDRGEVVDQDTAPIKLKKGENQLLLKISQGGGGWSACARIVGAGGKPIPGLRIDPQAAPPQ